MISAPLSVSCNCATSISSGPIPARSNAAFDASTVGETPRSMSSDGASASACAPRRVQARLKAISSVSRAAASLSARPAGLVINTLKAGNGYKTRPFERILTEVRSFIDVAEAQPGVVVDRTFAIEAARDAYARFALERIAG